MQSVRRRPLGAELTDASLASANLSGARLSFASLVGTVLTGANLDGAILVGADMTLAILSGARVDGADFGDTLWSKTTLARVTGLESALGLDRLRYGDPVVDQCSHAPCSDIRSCPAELLESPG